MWKDLLSFTKSELYGYGGLLIIGIGLFTFTLFRDEIIHPKSKENIVVEETIIIPENIQLDVFEFDPNTVSIKELEKLGVNVFAIVNWKKYLEAGGRFKTTSDLYKIKGIDSAFIREAQPFITFNDALPKTNFKSGNHFNSNWVDLNQLTSAQMREMNFPTWLIDSIVVIQNTHWMYSKYDSQKLLKINSNELPSIITGRKYVKLEKERTPLATIELNSADSVQLLKLAGIGSVLAGRIVKYRIKLGGFYCINQLSEVYGISTDLVDTMKNHLSINQTLIHPIQLNTFSLDKLKNHPYIGFYKARKIIDYRNKEGRIHSVESIFTLLGCLEDERVRLESYLNLN